MITKKNEGTIVSIKEIKAAVLHSGDKRKRNDLCIIYSEVPAQAAAVYTLNKIKAEPLKLTKQSLNKDNMIQAIIVNSGNANACTGKQGMLDAIEMKKVTAEKYNVKQDHEAVASTGVDG